MGGPLLHPVARRVRKLERNAAAARCPVAVVLHLGVEEDASDALAQHHAAHPEAAGRRHAVINLRIDWV